MMNDPIDDQGSTEHKDLSEDTVEFSLDITIDEDFDPYLSEDDFDDSIYETQSEDLSEITVETPLPEHVDQIFDKISEDNLLGEERDLTSEGDD